MQNQPFSEYCFFQQMVPILCNVKVMSQYVLQKDQYFMDETHLPYNTDVENANWESESIKHLQLYWVNWNYYSKRREL